MTAQPLVQVVHVVAMNLKGFGAVWEPPASGSAANAKQCAAPQLGCQEVQGLLLLRAVAGSCVWGWGAAEGRAAIVLSTSCCTHAWMNG